VGNTVIHKNKIVIIGNPNVGKSALFNNLTKDYSIVANYPYTTIKVTRGETKIGGGIFELIDTPGINSLEIQSEDEIITRDILIREHPEYIIQCIDANNVKRSLLLTSQLLEVNIPLIICLNNIDSAMQKGLLIDSAKMSSLLGVPVIETIATEGRGLRELTKNILNTECVGNGFKHKDFIERSLEKVSKHFPFENPPSNAVLLLLLLQDEGIEEWVQGQYGESIYQDVKNLTNYLKTSISSPLTRIIFRTREEWAEKIANEVTGISRVISSRIFEKFGKLTHHPVFGWPILGVIIYLTYLLEKNRM